MSKTAIEWTDDTWNPVRGCSRVSEGCRHCYAEQQAARIVRMGKGTPTAYDGLVKLVRRTPDYGQGDETVMEARWTGVVRLVPEHLADPLRWKKPRRIFVNSMSDLFHEKLTNEQIAAVFGVMAACPQHTFQVLTKRAKRMREWFEWVERKAIQHYDPPSNVWIGVSVENQEAADERIPDLLATPAAVRFISAEPLLGPVELQGTLDDEWDRETGGVYLPRGWLEPFRDTDPMLNRTPRIDWVIAGCESGPGARPCDVAWLRSLRDQCAAAGVPYFLKQAVGCIEPGKADERGRVLVPAREVVTAGDGSHRKPGGAIGLPYLDGVQHAAFPINPNQGAL